MLLGTCNYCEKNANNQLVLKDKIAQVSAEIILDLGKIIRLGQEHKFQVILLRYQFFVLKNGTDSTDIEHQMILMNKTKDFSKTSH